MMERSPSPGAESLLRDHSCLDSDRRIGSNRHSASPGRPLATAAFESGRHGASRTKGAAMGLRVAKLLGAVALMAGTALAGEPDDPLLWLEDVTGERALSWVRERNA